MLQIPMVPACPFLKDASRFLNIIESIKLWSLQSQENQWLVEFDELRFLKIPLSRGGARSDGVCSAEQTGSNTPRPNGHPSQEGNKGKMLVFLLLRLKDRAGGFS
jgi:hypothetical protein